MNFSMNDLGGLLGANGNGAGGGIMQLLGQIFGGGAAQASSGGPSMQSIIGLMNGGGGPSTTAYGGEPYPTPSPLDIPAADMRDPFGGPQWAERGYSPGQAMSFYNNPFLNFNAAAPFGNTPLPGLPGSSQGPTAIPTFFDPQAYPYAPPMADSPGGSGKSSTWVGGRKNQ